jgi:hypothetical protein
VQLEGYYQEHTLDVDTTDTENTSDSKLGVLTLRWSMQTMTPLSKGLYGQEKQT